MILMKRLIALLTCVFASCTVFAVANGVELSSVHKIILAELSAMKLPVDSPICPGNVACTQHLRNRGRSISTATSVLNTKRDAATKGISLRQAPTQGERDKDRGNRRIGGPTFCTGPFSDITITPERDLGILYRRGVYELIKDEKGEWVIQSYVNEMKK